ncbi:MAG: hypothetical protein WDZ51_06895 [Pirellulaceae bacterium]
MKSIYRTVTAPTFLYSLLLIALGAAMYGETYLSKAQEAWFEFRLERPDLLAGRTFQMRHKDRFTSEDGNEYRIYLLSDLEEGDGATHRDRFVVASTDREIVSITEHHQVTPFNSAAMLPTNLRSVFEVVRYLPHSESIHVLRYDLSHTGVRITNLFGMQNRDPDEAHCLVQVRTTRSQDLAGGQSIGDRAEANYFTKKM